MYIEGGVRFESFLQLTQKSLNQSNVIRFSALRQSDYGADHPIRYIRMIELVCVWWF